MYILGEESAAQKNQKKIGKIAKETGSFPVFRPSILPPSPIQSQAWRVRGGSVVRCQRIGPPAEVPSANH